MSKNVEGTTSRQLTLSVGDSPVRTCQLPEKARVWLESEVDSGLSSVAFLKSLSPGGRSSRMSPAYYPIGKDGTLPPSFKGWRNSGIYRPGGSWTLNTTEWHRNAAVCSLSRVLEAEVAQKFYLSARAARGILRRAAQRGKELPPRLRQALQAVVEEEAGP